MKKFFLTIIILQLSGGAITSAIKKETGITGSHLSEISPAEYTLSYTVSNTYETELYSDIPVTIPFEKHIIQGRIKNNYISEKDFLFSQTDIDLNRDNDYEDTFPVSIQKQSLLMNNVLLSLIIRKSANYRILYPFQNEKYNVNKISDNGIPFTLRDYSPDSGTIMIGLTRDKNIEFEKFKNSVILIEIVTPGILSEGNILIDGVKPFEGVTNEHEVSGGEKSGRYVAAKNIFIRNSSGKGEFRIKNIRRPFNIRLEYYFAISENLISMTRKIIEVK